MGQANSYRSGNRVKCQWAGLADVHSWSAQGLWCHPIESFSWWHVTDKVFTVWSKYIYSRLQSLKLSVMFKDRNQNDSCYSNK